MWPIPVSSEMDVDVNGSKIVKNDSSDLDMEAQEDILMLKAHMGEFDHLLEDSANTEHLLDRSQFLPSKNVEENIIHSFETPRKRSRHVELDESSDEEPLTKGESSKKRRAGDTIVIDLEDEEASEEEDLDKMKMRKYDTGSKMGPPLEPVPKKRQFQEIDSSGVLLHSVSAPSTPSDNILRRAMLNSTGRYYDDTELTKQVKTCRFCARSCGVAYHPPSNKISCFKCGGEHIARDCPNTLCFNCWELGHLASNCVNARRPKTSCFRCGGAHDALFCLQASDKRKSSDSHGKTITLPILCCNCGQMGHTFNECNRPSMEDTKHDAQRDTAAWFAKRVQQEISKPKAQHRPRSQSQHGNPQPSKSKGYQTPSRDHDRHLHRDKKDVSRNTRSPSPSRSYDRHNKSPKDYKNNKTSHDNGHRRNNHGKQESHRSFSFRK